MEKEQLLKHADELLAFVLQGLEQGKDFVAEQMPLLIQEVIKWGIAEHTIYVVTYLMIVIFTGLVLRVAWRNKNEDWTPPLFVFGGMFHFAAWIAVIINAVTITKAIVAPRLYLLDQLRTLLK